MDSQQYLTSFEQFLQLKSQVYFGSTSYLHQAINYSLLSGGKRIRPLFCLGFSHSFGGNQDVALRCALAVEMIHTYSLIHDDLPAMDNDDFRRGRPTNHKVYGQAHAILAGDSLLTASIEILMQELSQLHYNPLLIIELTTLLLKASGHDGMIKGQALDIEAERKMTSFAEGAELLNFIHHYKTGQLISWSSLAGLYSTGDKELIEKYCSSIQTIGEKFGLLFQIIDDLLDVTSTYEELGKTPGKDEKSGKLTFCTLYGLEKTHFMAKNLIKEITDGLEKIFPDRSKIQVILEIVQMLDKKIVL